VSSVPVPVAGKAPRTPRVTRQRAGNGLEVIVARRPGIPMAEFRLRIPVPAHTAAEEVGRRLLAATLLAGTERLDAVELAGRLQELGGRLDAGAGTDAITMAGAALSLSFRPFLDLVAEVLTGAAFPTARVRNERDRLVQELILQRSQPGVIAGEALDHRFYGRHPYGRGLPSAGAMRRIGRGTLRSLHSGIVAPAGAYLVIVGDVEPKPTAAAAADALGAWEGAGGASRLPEPAPPAPGPILVHDRPGAFQTNIRVAAPVVPRHDPEYPALVLAELVLGGYFGSRISLNLREDKGYGYSPRSSITHGRAASRFVAAIDVATEVTGAALNETRYEMGRMCTTLVSQDELDEARRYRVGILALGDQTQAGLASHLDRLVFAGLDESWLRTHPADLARVTREDVLAASNRFFAAERTVTVMLGDAARIVPQLEGLGPVEVVTRS